MIRIVRGRSGSGKTLHMAEMLKALDPFREEAVVIVPDQSTLDYEIRLMKALDVKGFLHISVFSFSRFVDEVLKQTGYSVHDKPLLDDMGTAMLIGRAIRDHEGALAIFGKGCVRAGFLELLGDLMRELVQLGAQADTLKEMAGKVQDPHLKDKLGIVADLYGRFLDETKERYEYGEFLFDRAIEVMDEYLASRRLHIFVDEFTGFTHHEVTLLMALASRGVEVNIALGIDPDDTGRDAHVFKAPQRGLDILRRSASECGVELTYEDCHGAVKDACDGSLIHLEKYLYAVPFEKYPLDCEAIGMIRAQEPYDEVVNGALIVLRQLQDNGWSMEDLAVAVTDMPMYAPLIERVFGGFGIPCFIDNKRPVSSHPLIRVILAALSCIRFGLRQEDVIAIAKSGLTTFDRYAVERFENIALERGLRGRRWLQPFIDLVHDSVDRDDSDGSGKSDIEEVRAGIIGPLEALRIRLAGTFAASEGVSAIEEWLAAMGILEASEALQGALGEAGELEAALEYAQSKTVLEGVFNQLLQVGADDNMTLEAFQELLRMGLSSHEVGIIPPSPDKLAVVAFDRSVVGRRKGIIILGLNDGLIPRQKSTKGILSNMEKRLVADLGLPMRTELDAVGDEETFAIYKIFTSATEKLWLSHASTDAGGRALRPSILLDMVRKRLPKVKQIQFDRQSLQNPDNWLCPAVGLKALSDITREESCRSVTGEPLERLAPDYRLLHEWFEGHESWKVRVDAVLKGSQGTMLQDRIDKAYAEKFFGNPLVTSVSRLERFAACPFRHFVEFALRPEPRKTYQMQLPELGIIYHGLIEQFGKDMQNRWEAYKTFSRKDIEGIVATLVTENSSIGGMDLFKKNAYGKFALRRFKQVATESAWRMLEQVRRGAFLPAAYEIGFGDRENSTLPPLRLEISTGEEIRLEGRIDRVDLYDGEDGKAHVRIVDYKTGGTSFDMGAVYQGVQLQLMLYLESMIEQAGIMGRNGLEGAGAFYYRIHDPLVRACQGDTEEIVANRIKKLTRMDGILLDDEEVIKAMDNELDESDESLVVPVKTKKGFEISSTSNVIGKKALRKLMDRSREHAAEYGEAMMAGDVLAHPLSFGDRLACDQCNHKGICRFEQGLEGHEVRKVRKMTKKDVVEKLMEEEETDHGQMDR